VVWLSDAMRVNTTLTSSIANLPKRLLDPGKITVDMMQTLAEYVVKWYTPNALGCAVVLYERILAELDGAYSSPSDPDKKRAHVVRELAKVYVEMLGCNEYCEGILPDISPAQYAVIQQGLEEIEKCGTVSERLEFYQHLGALHVRYAAKDPRCSSQEGERMLRNVYETQARLFGLPDHRCVTTVDILSRYYVERGGRDVEAAQLIQDTLQAVGAATCQPEDESGEGGEENEDEEDAEDAKWRGVVEKWEALVARTDTRAASRDIDFAMILAKCNLQARLMQLLAPPGWVWQDSRLYLCDITEIRFRRVAITDALDNYPVRITQLGDGLLDIRLPIANHPFCTGGPLTSMSVSEVVRSVRESHFYIQLLLVNSERITPDSSNSSSSGDDDSDGDNLGPQVCCSSWETMGLSNSPDEAASHPKPSTLAKLGTDHALWVFPRDLGPPAAGTNTTLSYQLEELPDRPKEWLVRVTESSARESPPIYLYIGDDMSRPPTLTYVHRVRNSTWEWRGGSTDNMNGDEFACSVDEKKNKGSSESSSPDGRAPISVVCPYVTYDELRMTKGFGWGFKYANFVQLLRASAH